jgi:hypothetical protein
MNIEVQYPELINMKKDELFVEWAYIVKEFRYIKVYIRKIIPKKERNIFKKALELEYDVHNDETFECINLVTIEK